MQGVSYTMKRYQYKNPRGQEVGYVENNIYYTSRSVKRGEIFLRKRVFNGKEIDDAIAIDKPILNDLYTKGVEFIEVTIIGIEKLSFKKYVPVETVILKGEEIKFDKRNEYGQNVTGFGKQVVFSYGWGTDKLQTKLKCSQ